MVNSPKFRWGNFLPFKPLPNPIIYPLASLKIIESKEKTSKKMTSRTWRSSTHYGERSSLRNMQRTQLLNPDKLLILKTVIFKSKRTLKPFLVEC